MLKKFHHPHNTSSNISPTGMTPNKNTHERHKKSCKKETCQDCYANLNTPLVPFLFYKWQALKIWGNETVYRELLEWHYILSRFFFRILFFFRDIIIIIIIVFLFFFLFFPLFIVIIVIFIRRTFYIIFSAWFHHFLFLKSELITVAERLTFFNLS